jgi:hypothetical protein
MPFQSPKQRRYMHANLPEIANRWEKKYGLGGIAELNSQLNSLPEYYLPKNQGGRIGFDKGTEIPEKFLEDLKRKNYYKMLEEFRRWKEDYERRKDLGPTQEAAHGGFIPSHEAGIYGLAEGGQLVKPGPGRPGYGGPHETEAAGKASTASSSGGGGEYRGGETYMAPVDVTSTYTTPEVTTGDGDAREKYISEQYKQPKRDIYAGTDLEEQLEIDKRIAQRKLDYGLNLTKQEKKNLEVGLGLIDVKPKKGFWGTVGTVLAVATGLAPILGIKVPGIINTAAQASSYMKQANNALDQYNKFTGSNHTFKSLANKVTTEDKLREETQKLKEALPRGHPESIALEAQTKTITSPKDGPDGEGVNIKYTSEEITDTNDAKADIARLEQKYQEMDEASRLAWQQQQQMQEAKRQAYLRNFRQMYMSAQGGRVPQGYNTGGLSNLFRLKNV